MKKLRCYVFVYALINVVNANAQESLTLNRPAWPYILFQESGTGVARVQGKSGHFVVTDINGSSNFLTVNSTTGNVGIGLSNSPVKLSVDGALQVGQKQPIYFLGGPNDANYVIQSGEWNDGMKYKHYTSHQFYTQDGTERLRIIQNGNVGIGTKNPDFTLTVNGKIKAEEIQVVVDVPADYVFETEYKLMPLSEVARYINEHKHLPNVPSADQLKVEGWQVGEMNNKLLEKIEELTLYLIEMKNEIRALQAENAELKKSINK